MKAAERRICQGEITLHKAQGLLSHNKIIQLDVAKEALWTQDLAVFC
jgi:hypothetical protein